MKVLGRGGLPSHDSRRWRSEPHLRVSLERLAAIFDYLEEIDVRMYRMTAHADLVDPIGFEAFLRGPAAGRNFDVMLEAKAKDLALLRLREQLLERGFDWEGGRITPEENE